MVKPSCYAWHGSVLRRGFTLLEVLIAMALFSTLLALLFSLFHTYTRLAERSRRTATEIQLVRSLSRQLRTDVDHFASLPLTPNIVIASDDQLAEPSFSASSPDTEPVRADPTALPAPSLDPRPRETQLEADTGQAAGLFAVVPSRLPEVTYLNGSATKLELVTRLPYTVNAPQASQVIGDETRYGTYQLVIYEYRDAKDLQTLLAVDPVLNPPNVDPQVPSATPTMDAPPAPRRSDPNELAGLIRETKSWLQVTRDRRREAMQQQAQSAARFGERSSVPSETRNLAEELRRKASRSTSASRLPADSQATQHWMPPQEMRAHRDHLPEVTRLQFRYFDGEQWRIDWQGAEGQLPVAIEVAFDVDPDAPAVRAKEFEQAHARMVAGAALEEVLPPAPEPDAKTFADLQDPLAALSLDDPTAIVTEYRFVIALSRSRREKSDSFTGDAP